MVQRSYGKSAALTAGMAALALIAGCGGQAADERDPGAGGDEIQSIEEAAIEEGQLTLYASAGESQIEAMAEKFMDDYPEISVDYFRAAGTALFNRFATEAESGSVTADVFMPTVQPSFVEENAEWFVELGPDEVPALAEWPEEFQDEYTFEIAVEEVVAIYNTETVQSAPASWEDVLDEQYQGRIVLVDPESSPGYMSWYSIMQDRFGDEFLTGLAELDPVWVDTGAVGAQQVAAGSHDISLPNYPSHAVALIAQSAPIEMVTDLDPTQGITTSVALTANAPNPNAAKLFANWLTTQSAYEAVCADGVYSATVEGTDCLPLASNFVEPVWEVPGERQEEIVELLGR